MTYYLKKQKQKQKNKQIEWCRNDSLQVIEQAQLSDGNDAALYIDKKYKNSKFFVISREIKGKREKKKKKKKKSAAPTSLNIVYRSIKNSGVATHTSRPNSWKMRHVITDKIYQRACMMCAVLLMPKTLE